MKIELATTELINLLLSIHEGKDLELLTSDSSPSVATVKTNFSRRSSVAYIELNLTSAEAAEMRRKKKMEELRDEVSALFEYFSRKNSEALVQVTRGMLEKLRKALHPPVINYSDQAVDKGDRVPVLKVQLELAIPSLILKPNLDSIQGTINDIVQTILGVHKRVYQWGQTRVEPGSELDVLSLTSASQSPLAVPSQTLPSPSHAQVAKKPELKNFHKIVSEHKDVAKLVSGLTSVITAAKTTVMESFGHFNAYEDLWKSEQSKKIEEFTSNDPSLGEFEEEMRHYEVLEDVIMSESDQIIVGAFLLDASKIILCKIVMQH